MIKRLYNLNIPIIGITGGIATGKSSVSEIIRDKDEQVICADQIIKKLYELTETVNYIRLICPDVVNSQGDISFEKLRKIFFNDYSIKNKLEDYLHPKIKGEFLNQVENSKELVFYDVPLLFEKKMQSHFDKIILVTSEESIQIKRLMKRDNVNKDLAKKIISTQLPLKTKETLSDYIIKNNLNLQNLKEKATDIYERIKLSH